MADEAITKIFTKFLSYQKPITQILAAFKPIIKYENVET
jgi:hypothetical protein